MVAAPGRNFEEAAGGELAVIQAISVSATNVTAAITWAGAWENRLLLAWQISPLMMT